MTKRKKVLLLGGTGKMGLALQGVMKTGYEVVEKSSRDLDASDFEAVRQVVEQEKPEIVINTVAYMGIDACEKDPMKALLLNALLPRFLAGLSNEAGFILVHFSTDSVFDDNTTKPYTEYDSARPLSVYGLTKYGGDCFVWAVAKQYYVVRISILFGESLKETQFVEKMLAKVRQGQRVLKVADDIVASPCYSKDVACEVKRILDDMLPYGLYHVANAGQASLFQLMQSIVSRLKLDVQVEHASWRDFPSPCPKNTFTPITSAKRDPLRPWEDAVQEYCLSLAGGKKAPAVH